MTKVIGTIKATGALMKVGLGFKPRRLTILNAATRNELHVSEDAIDAPNGITVAALDGVRAKAANAAAGVVAYDGNSRLNAPATNEFVEDTVNYLGEITRFTLGSVANKTGNFNAGVDTGKVGVGSKVTIGREILTITALANDGDAANEVTLNKVPEKCAVNSSINVGRIGPSHGYRLGKEEEGVPSGFELGAGAAVNQAGDRLEFVAEG